MVFIWNGINYKVVDAKEFGENAENYCGYVIARRLFVSLLKPNQTNKYLYERFNKYGQIESVKMLKGKNEGYVTFATDHDAGFAFLMEKDCSDIKTEIAYVWHQPETKVETAKADGDEDEHMELDEPDTPPILELCDELLFMIFDRCDNKTLVNFSETCVRFANLLEKQYRFQNIDNELIIGIEESSAPAVSITLIELHKLVRLMGHYFEILTIEFYEGVDETIHPYMREIAKYCTNTQRMFFSVRIFRNDLVSLLEPIFRNLKALEIQVNQNEINPTTDLTKLLPKLEELEFEYYGDPFLNMFSSVKWPSLKCINTREELDEVFFALNPQLQCLRLKDCAIYVLDAVDKHLPNVEEIQLTTNMYEDGFSQYEYLVYLGGLTKLTKLILDSIHYEKLIEVVGYIKGLNNLKELIIHFKPIKPEILTNEHQQAIISLAETHRNIERVKLVGMKLDEATVVDFVRFAPKLKSLHLNLCNFSGTASLISKIIDVRKCNQENPNKLELCFGQNELEDLDAIDETEIEQYLDLMECDEFGRKIIA